MGPLLGTAAEHEQFTTANFTHELGDKIFEYKITSISIKH